MAASKRPRRRRKDARPAEIIDAAFRVFERTGFGKATLAEIAKQAGISRTTVYLYFDTKEAIFEAGIRGSIERAIDDVASLVKEAPGDFRTVFSQAVAMIYQRLLEGHAAIILKTLIAEGQAMPELVAFYRREILAKGERAIKALIERGVHSGELSPTCRDIDARLLISPAIFAALWLRVFQSLDPLDVESFKQAHIKIVCDALLAQ